MAQIMRVGGKGIGWEIRAEFRKKPILVVVDGDYHYPYGTFMSEHHADAFMRKLCSLISGINRESQKHGSWEIANVDEHGNPVYECSECKANRKDDSEVRWHREKTPFCPECGAKMDREKKDETGTNGTDDKARPVEGTGENRADTGKAKRPKKVRME